VKQERISFIYKEQSFNIHTYIKPVRGTCILHLQGISGVSAAPAPAPGPNKRRGSIVKGKRDAEFELPDFVEVDRLLDLKGKDAEISAYNISKINK
jgi:hypothetical protein